MDLIIYIVARTINKKGLPMVSRHCLDELLVIPILEADYILVHLDKNLETSDPIINKYQLTPWDFH